MAFNDIELNDAITLKTIQSKISFHFSHALNMEYGMALKHRWHLFKSFLANDKNTFSKPVDVCFYVCVLSAYIKKKST